MGKTINQLTNSRNRSYSPVAVLRTIPKRDAIIEDVHRAMEIAQWRDNISSGVDIAIKPNLGWDKLIPGSISAPWTIEAVIINIREYVGKIYLVESNQVVVNVEKALHISRLDEVCRRHNVSWINMSKKPYLKIREPERLILHEVNIPEILTRTELITVPLMKTHNKTTITGAIKNQWGCLEELRHNFHPFLSEALVDINTIIRPKFAVMDATVGLEGNGPKSGRPKEMNLILASGNLVGLDGIAASIMGFDPHQISHLKLCEEYGLGSLVKTNEIRGEVIEDLVQQFTPARHNPVSWFELILRKSFLEWLVFKTPIFNMMTWGARRYYDLWDLFIGRKIREDFFSQSDYSKQWI